MKKILYLIALVSVVFTACDEPTQDWMDEYDEASEVSDAAYLFYMDRTELTGAYTLTEDDYANSSNSSVANYNNFSESAKPTEYLKEVLDASFYAAAGVEVIINYDFYRGRNNYAGTYDTFIEYTLETADYDSMGEENGPGKYDNFSSSVLPADYLPAFLGTKYTSEVEGTVAKVFYKYYAGSVEDRSDLYILIDAAWVPIPNSYELTDADYDEMGEGPGKYSNFSSSAKHQDYLPTFLKLKYPYAKAEDVVTVVYKYYSGETTTNGVEYVYDGMAWAEYATTIVASSVAKFNINDKWIVVPPMDFVVTEAAHTKEYTLTDADYELVGDGQYHNFTYYEYPEVTDWLLEKVGKILKANLGGDEGLKTLAIGDIVKVNYVFYNGSGGSGSVVVEVVAAE